MLCTILKPFDLSTDGVKARRVTPADSPVEVPDSYVPGLEAEGFVSTDVKPAKKPAKTEGEGGGDKSPAELEALIAEATALGIDVGEKPTVKKLTAAIAKAKDAPKE